MSKRFIGRETVISDENGEEFMLAFTNEKGFHVNDDENIWKLSDEELATKIKSSEWDYDLMKEICYRAGLTGKLQEIIRNYWVEENEDFESQKRDINKIARLAAKRLDVEI